jgi:hypothetical protein
VSEVPAVWFCCANIAWIETANRRKAIAFDFREHLRHALLWTPQDIVLFRKTLLMLYALSDARHPREFPDSTHPQSLVW